MTKGYNLLKGTVSHLHVMDDPKELRADDIGLLAIIGLMIVGAFEAIVALIGALSADSVTLEGKSYQCYVGRKKVQGKLVHVSFKNGDYVEMLVKPIKFNEYQPYSVGMPEYLVYAVRIPQFHALYFPHSVGVTTLVMLKYLSIGVGGFCLFTYILTLILILIDSDEFFFDFILITMSTIIEFFFILVLLFLLARGSYTFISNRVFATLGYPKPWLHDCSDEHERFKKLNLSGDPELYDDPQTSEFEQLKELDPNANYYCRTPTLPDWVTVIDERGLMPQSTQQQETPNQEQSYD